MIQTRTQSPVRGRSTRAQVGKLAARFLASLYLPREAFITVVVVLGLLALLVITAKRVLTQPIDISWLYYVNFLLVYSLQVGPILVYGVFALKQQPPFSRHAPTTRFLCLIPAYNEERVIQNSVGSLLNQDYSKDLYEVYVVSDGSQDRRDRDCVGRSRDSDRHRRAGEA
jgi:hypothetical protein